MGNNRILIVDDDPGVRDSYKEILYPTCAENIVARGASLFDGPTQDTQPVGQKQYDLVLAETGEEGVKAVEAAVEQRSPFAAAFIDMKMPGMDGAETAKRIWAINPNMKIVIVTAYSEHTPDDIIRVTGRDDLFYLRKPFNPEEIRQFARAFANQWNIEMERKILSGKLAQANKELEDMNKRLQERVEEQAAMLVQSEKMASMGVLSAGIAHEINNPISFVSGNLSALKGYSNKIVQLLQRYVEIERHIDEGKMDTIPALMEEIGRFKDDEELDFILEDIVNLVDESLEGTRRVSKIVNDLRTFSRVDEAELKCVNLNETMDTTLNLVWNELKYKPEIIKDYADLPEVKCFCRKISQVFMNILVNAAQSIEKSGTIKIVTRHIQDGRRAEDAHVEIRISDTGSGIPKKQLSKVFDPFFTTKPVGQGRGLGMSISYDIIKAHGGKITVDSKEGAGATFIINLPLEAKL